MAAVRERHPGCQSNECAIRNVCTGSAVCGHAIGAPDHAPLFTQPAADVAANADADAEIETVAVPLGARVGGLAEALRHISSSMPVIVRARGKDGSSVTGGIWHAGVDTGCDESSFFAIEVSDDDADFAYDSADAAAKLIVMREDGPQVWIDEAPIGRVPVDLIEREREQVVAELDRVQREAERCPLVLKTVPVDPRLAKLTETLRAAFGVNSELDMLAKIAALHDEVHTLRVKLASADDLLVGGQRVIETLQRRLLKLKSKTPKRKPSVRKPSVRKRQRAR